MSDDFHDDVNKLLYNHCGYDFNTKMPKGHIVSLWDVVNAHTPTIEDASMYGDYIVYEAYFVEMQQILERHKDSLQCIIAREK